MKNKTVIAVSAVISVLALAEPGRARPWDEAAASGELAAVVYRDYPPFSYRRGGDAVGVDVDLAKALAERLGLRLRLIELTADESVDDDLRNGVWKGSKLGQAAGDVMMHVPYDRELDIRNDRVFIIAPYFRETMAAVRRAPTQSLGMLTGLRIGVEVDSLGDHYLSGAFGGRMNGDLHRYPTIAAAAAELRSGGLDALVGPRGELEGALGRDRGSWKVSTPGFPGLPKPSWPLGMAVKDDSRDLGYAVEDALASLIKDGTLGAVFRKYGLTYLPP